MISIIIPTYNRAIRLEGAVRSVLAQSVGDWELIVVDDGSTDQTPQLMRCFNDPRVRCLKTDHRGVSAARNAGIGESRYPWVCFLDSDDRWMPQKLEQQLRVVEADQTVRVIYTNEIWIRHGRRVNPRKKHRKYSGWIYRQSLPLCIISPSSVMLDRTLLENVGRFDESFIVCEDYELWLRVTSRCPVYFLDQPLITKVGGHEDQLSRTVWGFDRFRLRALLKIAAGGSLSAQQSLWTCAEIVKKASILGQGFANRGKTPEAQRYRRIASEWAGRMHWSQVDRRRVRTHFDERPSK